MSKRTATSVERVVELLTLFKLPTLATELPARFDQDGQQEALGLVLELLEMEAGDRRQRRVERLQRASKLPPGKTFGTLQDKRLPRPLAQKLADLATGAFLEQATNVLAFGLPGTGKSHCACAIGQALIEKGHSVLFAPTFALVQDLLLAKRELRLPKLLRQLDNFELLILDDIGYVQQSAEEVEVLFTLMAERYERASMLITSNLVFSEWDRIFKNPMTTAAAIDRLVHHSVILEFDVPSFRTEDAKARGTSKNKKGAAESSRAPAED
jgi:DNA replication protein DnaC